MEVVVSMQESMSDYGFKRMLESISNRFGASVTLPLSTLYDEKTASNARNAVLTVAQKIDNLSKEFSDYVAQRHHSMGCGMGREMVRKIVVY